MKNSMFQMRAIFSNATSEQLTALENAGFNVTNQTISSEPERLKGLEHKTLLDGEVFIINFRIDDFCKVVKKFQSSE
jgi:hypothetical protein